jgi:hypothetical protein
VDAGGRGCIGATWVLAQETSPRQRRKGTTAGLITSTLVIAGVTTVGLIMAVLDKGGARQAVRLAY